MTKKLVVTIVGKDRIGIIATVCNYFKDNDINILDIRQEVVQDFINMMMIVDAEKCKKTFPQLSDDLQKVGEKICCTVHAQQEDVFNMMHRI